MNIDSFGKSTFVYAIGNVGLRFAGFLLIPLYTHFLSVAETGQLMTLLITIQILVMLMKFGMLSSVVRFHQELETKNIAERLPCNSLFINLVSGIIITAIFVLFLPPFFRSVLKTLEVHVLIILACLASFSQSICIHVINYYRARNEPKKYTLASLLASTLLLLNVLLFLLILAWGVKGVLIAQILSYGIISLFILKKILSKTDFTLSMVLIKQLLHFGTPIAFSGVAWLLMNGSTRYFLGYFVGLEVVAIYSLGNLLASALAVGISVPFKLAYEPYVFSNLDRIVIRRAMARLFTYIILTLVLGAFVMTSISRELLQIIAPSEYASAYLIMLWLLPKFVFEGVHHVGNTLLLIEKKTHITASVFTVGVLLNLILNLILVPQFGWEGGALATNISFGLSAVAVLIVGIRKFWIPIEWGRIAIILGFFIYSLLMGLLLYSSGNVVVYVINALVLLATGIMLRYSSFLDEDEKSAIGRIKERIMYRTCLSSHQNT